MGEPPFVQMKKKDQKNGKGVERGFYQFPFFFLGRVRRDDASEIENVGNQLCKQKRSALFPLLYLLEKGSVPFFPSPRKV